MITTELKDNFLSKIVSDAPDLLAGFDIHEMATELNTNYRVIDALLREYESHGFMRVDRMLGGGVYCHLEVRVYDFVKNGGYKVEETL